MVIWNSNEQDNGEVDNEGMTDWSRRNIIFLGLPNTW